MNGNSHSLIVVNCQDCDQPDTVTLLDHSRDSDQHYAILDAHQLVADQHQEETGHSVEFDDFGGDREEMEEMARTLANDVGGVDDDAFDQELIA